MVTPGELELITGFSGTEHISSADDGAGYASIVGKGEYVSAETGEGFRAELVDSNTVRIYDGDAWFGGRHIRLAKGTYVDVKIDSGTQGQQRNDLIVIRYTKDASTEKEKAEFVAIKGTPTTGTPADPSYKAGSPLDGDLTCDFRLYRIHLNALTVDAPVKLFTDITPITALGNTIKIGSGSTSFRGLYYTFDAYYKPGCNVVEIVTSSRSGSTNGSGNGFSGIAFTLAAQYRPKDDVYMTSYALINGAYFMVGIYVYKDGGVGFFASSEAGAQTIGAMPLRCTFTPAI